MAIGMKHWIGLTLTGMALVALLFLPPGSALDYFGRETNRVNPAGTLMSNTLDEAHVTARMLTFHRRTKAIEERLAARADEEQILLTYPPELEQYGGEEARQRTRDAFEALDPPADVVVGVFYEPRGWKVPEVEGLQINRWVAAQLGDPFHAGTVDGRPYCVAVRLAAMSRTVFGRIINEEGAEDHPLQLCRFWAAHGAPGPHVDRWLRAGASGFLTLEWTTELLGSDMLQRIVEQPRRNVFGAPEEGLLGLPGPDTERCAAGDPEVCRSLFLDTLTFDRIAHAQARTRTRMTSLDSVRTVSSVVGTVHGADPLPFGLLSYFLMSELEEEMGRERFRAFWTSDLPVDEAFTAAFGVEPGVWVMEWLQSYYGVPRTGPVLRASTVGLGLLVLVFAAGAAMGLAHRREVT